MKINRRHIRKMILKEMSMMSGGGNPGQNNMSVESMMQELNRIEARLEELSLGYEEYVREQERYGIDPVEAAYGFEYNNPDYYDEIQELRDREYELVQMIDAIDPNLL